MDPTSSIPPHSATEPTLPALTGRADIERLVNAFYERVREDELLGIIFNDIASVDWSTHLPRMYAFWDSVMFRGDDFAGNPLAKHARLVPLTTMGLPQFERWIALFKATVDDLFAGEKAEHIKRCAEDMAHVIHSRINGVPDARFARFDPAKTSIAFRPPAPD